MINALKTERDVSVRQRAVDLLYAMCDRSNSEDIVLEMLTYLETADYSIREEMVLKVAILAEKYATDYKWYVDVILNLIRLAGDYVSEEVWYRYVILQYCQFHGKYHLHINFFIIITESSKLSSIAKMSKAMLPKPCLKLFKHQLVMKIWSK